MGQVSTVCAVAPYLKKCLKGEYKFKHQNQRGTTAQFNI